jgi:hypothetical protein
MKKAGIQALIASLLVIVFAASSYAEFPKMKMTTSIPEDVTTPDRVDTRIGTLEFFDGFPTEATAQKCFDKLHFPPNVPAKDFWSVCVYDNQTRSLLQTDQQFPSVSSQRGVEESPDGSYDVYFGPQAPKGKESNWIQTVPGKGWNVILRFYGPLQPWFDRSWRPGASEPVD